MAVKIVDDSYIYGLLAGELGRLDAIPDALVYETAVNAVRNIRQGQSRWPVDTSFSQQNFFAEIDGSIWNNANYAKYVEDRTNAIHDYLRENISNLLPESVALVFDRPLDELTVGQRRIFRRSRSFYRETRELTRAARSERRPVRFYELLQREARREARRRYDDEDWFEDLDYS